MFIIFLPVPAILSEIWLLRTAGGKLNTQNTLTESSFDLTKSSQVMSDLVKKLSQVKALFD